MENRKAGKNIIIRVTPDFHTKVKVRTALNGETIQDYLVRLITEDLEKEERKEK